MRKKRIKNKKKLAKYFSLKNLLAICGVIGLITAAIIGVTDTYKLLFPNMNAEYEILYYFKDKKNIELSDPSNLSIEMTLEDFINGTITLPVNLAIRNKENKFLDIVKIEIYYPSQVKLNSSGKILANTSSKIYKIIEHDIGVLKNSNNYTPIESTDEIMLPIKFPTVEAVGLTEDGVPMYLIMAISELEGMFKTYTSFLLPVKVYAKDNKVWEDILKFEVYHKMSVVGYFSDEDEPISLSDVDKKFVADLTSKCKLINEFSGIQQGRDLHYKKCQTTTEVFQLVFLDKKLKLVVLDKNKDGYINQLYVFSDNNSSHKLVFSNKLPMFDWKKKAISPEPSP